MFNNEHCQMIIKNDNCLPKLESVYGQNCISPCNYSFGAQTTTFNNMNAELINSGSLQNDSTTMLSNTIVENSNSNICIIPANNLGNSDFPQTLNSYHHQHQNIAQTFNLSTNSVQDLHIPAASQSIFPSPIPTVIAAAAAAAAGVNSASVPLSSLLFHPQGPYMLPNHSSTNLSTTHLQSINPQVSNIPLNNDYKASSPSDVLEATTTTHNQLPLITSSIDGTITNPIKTPSNSQSTGTNKLLNENGNYYVMVHVDAGETFSVRVGDQIQHIPGPATVRMVSNSGPPLPMPMQVPPGHLVQQIVDEEGILTHVILSPYPAHPSLSMVPTGVPLSLSQTNDASTTGTNLILNPNQHIQPHHQHHQHFHPILPSTGLPSNESLIHMNPYAQHPHSIHSFPHSLPTHPPPFIHPHFQHFHQQFHVHSTHPHVCANEVGTDGPISTKYSITPEVIDEINHCDVSTCDSPCLTVNKSSDSSYNDNNSSNNFSLKQNVIKEIPDSTTMNYNNNNTSNNNADHLIDVHCDRVNTLDDLHPIISNCCGMITSDLDKVSFLNNIGNNNNKSKKTCSPESLPAIDSKNEVKKVKSSKCTNDLTNHSKTVTDIRQDALNNTNSSSKKSSSLKCSHNYTVPNSNNHGSIRTIDKHVTQTVNSTDDDVVISSTHDDPYENNDDDNEDDNDDEDAENVSGNINCKTVGSCKTSFITDNCTNLTTVNNFEIRPHISIKDKHFIDGNMSSDCCTHTAHTTSTTAAYTNTDSIVYTTNSHITNPTFASDSNGRATTSSSLNAFSPHFSYPPVTFPFHRRRRGGGINGGGVVGVNVAGGGNKSYNGFRPHRPASFGFNKYAQNSVWNQPSTTGSSKSHSEHYSQHQQQHDCSLQNGSNHINHYQKSHHSSSIYQPHSYYHHCHSGPVVAQDVDIDSEIEIENKSTGDKSVRSPLPINVLLPTAQTPTDYCSQSNCPLNSQCYGHHNLQYQQPEQSMDSYDVYLSTTTNNNVTTKGPGTNENDTETNTNGHHTDYNLNNEWNTQEKIIHNLISNILSPQVSEVKCDSALIQLTFPQNLILSSVADVESSSASLPATSTSVTTITTSTNYISTNPSILTTNITTATTNNSTATILSIDSCQSLQSLLSENSDNNNININNNSKLFKVTNSPSKNHLLDKCKPSSTIIKGDNCKSDLIHSNINYDNTDNDNIHELDDSTNNISTTIITTETTTTSNNDISNSDNSQRYQITIDLDSLQFELYLAEKGNTLNFKCIFIGEATYISLQDLRPGTNYYVKVCCNYSGIRGEFSPIAHFITLSSKPNPPRTIQIICQTRNSLHIKWGPGIDNGSRITSYKLEYAQVLTNSSELGLDKNPDPEFLEPIQVFGRSYKINQLSPSTEYLIRVAAINQYGQSSWSPILSASTSGSPPEMPLPPFLIQADVHSLTLGWRPPTNPDKYQYNLHHHHRHHHHNNICDQTNSSNYGNHLSPITYTLEMDDQTMGHGFITVFDGSGTEHCVDNLRRNTRYRFRLAASNIDGRSRWSETVTLATLPDHPSPPRNLRIYGSFLQPTRLALTWDPPEDDGGIPIQAYRLEALLPYSNSGNSTLQNGTLTNGSNTKINDINNSVVNCSLEKIDDQIDVIQKLTCWPHVTPLKSGSSILSSINSSLSTIKSTLTSTATPNSTISITNTTNPTYTASSANDNYVMNSSDITYHPPFNSFNQKISSRTTVDMNNNNNDNTDIDHNQIPNSITLNNNSITNQSTDYDAELIYPQTAWFIIYEGVEKELLIDNLLPGLYLQLRVRACCSLANTNINHNMNPSCSSFSSSSSSSSSMLSGIISTLNLNQCTTDEMIASINVGTNVTNVNTNNTVITNSNNELWGLANYPALKIRMPPIPPSAPCSGPRVVGKPKPTSLHLCWSPPKQTGGAPILAYEVWQLTLESTCWINEVSEDNDDIDLSIHRLCSSTPTSLLELSILRSSCHNLECDFNQRFILNSCQSRHRQFILHRSYTDPSLNVKSYTVNNNTINNDNSVKIQSLFNDSSNITLGRFVCSVRETECRLFGLTPGQNYAFRVRARNRAGEGLWTEWISLSTPPSLPGVPTSSPRLLPKSPYIIHIAWDPVTCINGAKIYEYRLECRQYQSLNSMEYYDISSYKMNIPSENKSTLNSSSLENSSGLDSSEQMENDSFFQLIYAGPKLSFEMTGLQPASLFAFRFCAVNSAGAGPWSPIAKCWTPSAPPDQPHGLCIRELNSESVLLLWVIPHCNGSPITNFMIEVTRRNNHYKSTSKSRVNSSNVKLIQIPAPYLMDHKKYSVNSSTKLPIISMTPDTSNSIQQQLQKKMMQYCLNKLKPSTTYILRIQAVNKFGPSEYSANIEFTTLAPLPKAPIFSQYTNLTSNSVRLEWNMLVDEIMNSDTDDMDNIDGDADTAGDDTSTDNYVNDETEEKIHSDETKEVNVEDWTNVKSNYSSRLSNPHHHHHQQQRERLKKQNLDLKPDESQLIFTLQMSRESDLDWTTIYEGQSNMHKVNRLSEFTIYHFRVCAMNTTGFGLYSGIQTIRTQKASPPAVRGLKILELNSDRCQLEWTPVNQLGMDPIIYLLHLLPVTANIQQSTNLNQVYRGNQTACRITGLNPGSEYVCRVCAVRLCQPTAKLPVINNSTTTFEQEQSKDNPKIDSSQYQITELPGPFSHGLLFTTPRLTKDNQFDSTSSSVSPSPSVTVSASCHLFRQKDSLSYKGSNGLLKILSSPYYIVRNMISRNSSNIRSTSVYPIHETSNWTTLSKQDHIHSNQVIATGTSPNSPLHNNNVSDKRRSILLHTISSTTSLSTQSTTNSTSSPRNQSRQQLSSHHNSKRSHSHWFRFTDTQLACLLLILFSLATLLVAMSLQYVLNVHLKLSNPTTTSSSGSSGSFSSMDLSPSSSESYGMKLKLNHDKKNNDGSSVFTTTTTTSKRTNQNVHS